MAAARPFFNKLPAEIRNSIYELTFEPDNDEDAEVDLLNGKPPSKSLVLSCRQAYEEANNMYKAAYRNYWTSSNFSVYSTFNTVVEVEARIRKIKPRDLVQINHLTISRHWYDELISVFGLVDRRGGWASSSKKDPTNRYFIKLYYWGDYDEKEELEAALDEEPSSKPMVTQIARLMGGLGEIWPR